MSRTWNRGDRDMCPMWRGSLSRIIGEEAAEINREMVRSQIACRPTAIGRNYLGDGNERY